MQRKRTTHFRKVSDYAALNPPYANVKFIMGIINWFKNKTVEGKIKKRVGSIKSLKGKGRLEIDLLEAKVDDEDVYRVNIVRYTLASHQSLSIVVSGKELGQLAKQITSEI
ncbi:MAG: hypothetical protein D3909_11840 [Candidatus Electrothrix sp. ATG1]|nr:hypothetical protein [Candidatus Electrothrix sp. ATG1]